MRFILGDLHVTDDDEFYPLLQSPLQWEVRLFLKV